MSAMPLSPWRATVAVAVFALVFSVLGVRIGWLAVGSAAQPASAPTVATTGEMPVRAGILDRNGEWMAVTVPMWSLYAHPREIADAAAAAQALAGVFPDLDREQIGHELSDGRRFTWIRRRVMPAERQAVLDLGLPGIYFGESLMRVYPGGELAAHVLGGVRNDRQGVDRTRMVGVGGVERHFDDRLSDTAEPLRLSLDMRVQAMLHGQLASGIHHYGAVAGSAVLMEVSSGELRGMVSLPDFDPNRPGEAPPEAHFNHAAQGVYEFGSALKPITAALAIEHGGAGLETIYDIRKPIHLGGYSLREPTIQSASVTLQEALVRSSNIASATAALAVGGQVQKGFLGQLGLLERLPVELTEAAGGTPLYPKRWRKINTATIAYGHGIAITQLHLAAAYATLLGDGRRVTPTLLADRGEVGGERPRVVSARTVESLRIALRKVVVSGTARRAEVSGYAVGGKTGTAEIAKAGGSYEKEKVISTLVSAFPMHDPAYVLVVTLRDPKGIGDGRYRRSAGVTAAPIVSEMILRAAPLLGLPPVGDVAARLDGSDWQLAVSN